MGEQVETILIIVGVLVTAGLFFGIGLTMYIAKQVFNGTLYKKDDTVWPRGCSFPDNAEQVAMWRDGLEWGKENASYCNEVMIVNDGLKLYGEFFDYGFNKTVVILHGRTDCLWYSYYYAKPYKDAGYNILVTDGRAHGKSEGKYNTVGIKESKDLLKWMEYLHEQKNQEEIIAHGICVGSCAAVLLGSSKDCPSYFTKIIADGLFVSFKYTYKKHYQEFGHKLFPVYYEIWIWFWLLNHVSVRRSNPVKYAKGLKPEILFIYSREDQYSQDKYSMKLFNTVPGKKQIKWFEKGGHSHVRQHNVEAYDEVVSEFVKQKK